MIEVGVKTDCIEARYSYEWLFDLLVEEQIEYVQLGTFPEFYSLPDDWFCDLRLKAESRGLRIKSVFTAHRELGGFFVNDARMAAAARKGYERLIEAAALVGADYAGSNPGAVLRDQISYKQQGIQTYLKHLKELTFMAKARGLKGLTIEPMSCLAEPPSTPEEVERFLEEMWDHFSENHESTVPPYLCSDISHGLCDSKGNVVHPSLDLFREQIPFLAEFHFKNTDSAYNSTFGFSPEEQEKGGIDLAEFADLCSEHEILFNVDPVIGYLELPGPKLGRDFSDPLLGDQLRASLRALRQHFPRDDSFDQED